MPNNEKFINALIENLKNNKKIKLFNIETYEKNKELGEELIIENDKIKNAIEKCIEAKEKRTRYVIDALKKEEPSKYYRSYILESVRKMEKTNCSLKNKEEIYYEKKYLLEKSYFLRIKNKEFLLLKRDGVERIEFCYLNKENEINKIYLDKDSSTIILGVLKFVENDKLEETYSELTSFFEEF